jgi:hypothetical protein
MVGDDEDGQRPTGTEPPAVDLGVGRFVLVMEREFEPPVYARVPADSGEVETLSIKEDAPATFIYDGMGAVIKAAARVCHEFPTVLIHHLDVSAPDHRETLDLMWSIATENLKDAGQVSWKWDPRGTF